MALLVGAARHSASHAGAGGAARRLQLALWLPQLAALLAIALPLGTLGLDNGLGMAGPAMGWSSWNHFACAGLNARVIMETADAMASSGLKAAGYEYVNVDDCWAAPLRHNTTGELVPDPVKFPDGIAAVGTTSYSCEPLVPRAFGVAGRALCLLDVQHGACRRLL